MAGRSLNKAQLIGHLGKDPELRYTANGMAVATFSLATNERYKPADSDEWQDRTEWHNIVAWGRQAEVAGEYLAKGRQVYIEGRLQTRSWEGQDGVKRYTTEIVAHDLILLGGRGESGSYSQRPPHPADSYAPTSSGSSAGSYPNGASADASAPPMPPDGPDEDIPF